jgi:hypothetical protein
MAKTGSAGTQATPKGQDIRPQLPLESDKEFEGPDGMGEGPRPTYNQMMKKHIESFDSGKPAYLNNASANCKW